MTFKTIKRLSIYAFNVAQSTAGRFVTLTLGKSADDLRIPIDGELCSGMGNGPGIVIKGLDDPEFGSLI